MNFIERMYNQISEAISDWWNYEDIVPVKTAQQSQGQEAQGGEGQETKVIGKPGTEKPKPGEGKPGEGTPKPGEEKKPGEGKGAGQPQPGKSEPSSGAVAGKEGATAQGKEGDDKITGGKTSDKNDGKQWMDDHSKIEKGDGTAKNTIAAVYKEVENEYRKRSLGQGSGQGGLMTKVQDMLKEKFDISKILSRIGTFKRKLSEYRQRRPTYQAALFNPVTAQSDIMMKGSPQLTMKGKKEAIMIFAADTSGSIGTEDYKSIFGLINNIAEQFMKEEHGMNGRVYLIEWDTAVHLPMREWKHIKEIKPKRDLTPDEIAQMKLRGGGGTDISALFNFLDKEFVEKQGKDHYFKFSDDMPPFLTPDEKKKRGDTPPKNVVSQKLKPREDSYRQPSWDKGETEGAQQGAITIKEGGFDNIPFLIIYTDGYFTTPNIGASKLYQANPGNILYIVTSKEGIKNVNPRNFVYHNLHGEK